MIFLTFAFITVVGITPVVTLGLLLKTGQSFFIKPIKQMNMKTIIVSLFLALSFPALAQTSDAVIKELKTSVKVTTDNDSLFLHLTRTLRDNVLNYNVAFKKDRHGKYRQYAIYWPLEFKEEIEKILLIWDKQRH